MLEVDYCPGEDYFFLMKQHHMPINDALLQFKSRRALEVWQLYTNEAMQFRNLRRAKSFDTPELLEKMIVLHITRPGMEQMGMATFDPTEPEAAVQQQIQALERQGMTVTRNSVVGALARNSH